MATHGERPRAKERPKGRKERPLLIESQLHGLDAACHKGGWGYLEARSDTTAVHTRRHAKALPRKVVIEHALVSQLVCCEAEAVIDAPRGRAHEVWREVAQPVVEARGT